MQLLHWTPLTFARRAHSFRTRRAALGLTTSALFALAATACGGDALGPGAEATGSVTATGAISASGTGLALFQSLSSGGTSLFQVIVAPTTQPTNGWQLQIVNYSGRPAAGTYKLSPLSVSSVDPTANFYYASAGGITTFSSTSGQLVITSSSTSAVRGTFSFTATDATGGTSTVTVQGSFNALCAPGIGCL